MTFKRIFVISPVDYQWVRTHRTWAKLLVKYFVLTIWCLQILWRFHEKRWKNIYLIPLYGHITIKRSSTLWGAALTQAAWSSLWWNHSSASRKQAETTVSISLSWYRSIPLPASVSIFGLIRPPLRSIAQELWVITCAHNNSFCHCNEI